MKKLIYLAAPYTHKDPSVVLERVQKINRAAGRILQDGTYVYSPISHTHPIAVEVDLPKGWEFWRDYDFCLLSKCDELWVLMLTGFHESVGVNAEIKMARKLEIPVRMLEPLDYE